MIQILTKDRRHVVISADIDELTVSINIEQYSKLLLSISDETARAQVINDFKCLVDLNEDFNADVLDRYIHLIMQRYGLLVDYGMSKAVVETEETVETEVEEEVPY